MAYDHGLPRSQRESIQDAVIGLLDPLLRPSGPVESIIPISWRVHDLDSWELLNQLTNGRYPAISVACLDLDAKPQTQAPGRLGAQLDLQLVHVSRNLRGPVRGRAATDPATAGSPTAEVGLWGQLELARVLLIHKDLQLTSVQHAVLVEELEVSTQRGLSIWAQNFRVGIQVDVDWARNETRRLTELRTKIAAGGFELDMSTTVPVP